MRRAPHQMILALAAVAVALASLTAACAAPDAAPPQTPARARLDAVESWAFAIGDGALEGGPETVAERLGGFDLVVIDGEEASAEQVAAIRGRGTIVLAYLSVGTIEPWRSWYAKLEPYALENWEDWDEFYADVAAPGYRSSVEGIAAEMLDKGFDGLFADNVDMVEGHPDAEPGMTALVTALSSLTRGRRGLLFAQNGDEYERGLAPLLDGWNREDVTFRYDFDTESYVRTPATDHEAALAALASMKDAGLFVTTTDYLQLPGGPQQAEAERAARSAGALPFVSDIELGRLP